MISIQRSVEQKEDKMNILYIGKFFPRSLVATIKDDSKGKIGFSNHNFEMSVINGLSQQLGINLRCVSLPGVFSYPRNNRRLYTKSESYEYQGTYVSSVGFCNIVGIKEIWATESLSTLLVKEFAMFPSGPVHIIVNTPDNRLLESVSIARRKCNRCLTQTVIIPDVPSMVTSMDKQNVFKRIILGALDRRAMKKSSESDGLVLLTESMMDFIAKPTRHIVMEGIVSADTIDIEKGTEEEKKIILYTGTLRKIFGVQNLIKAFELISDNDAELWICGSGDSAEYIRCAAQKDRRIKFYGLVDSLTSLTLQQKAMILVNPRTSDGEYTKYSFPSKTMEYLLAAKSVVINRLPGILDEYYNYVYTPYDESVSALAKCIVSIFNISSEERHRFANKGREFVLEKKNSKVQMERVINLIQSYQ